MERTGLPCTEEDWEYEQEVDATRVKFSGS